MKITAITQQQSRKDRCSVFADGIYTFSLSQAQLADLGIRVGDDISSEQLHQFLQLSELGKALDKAYRFLSYRLRSRQEMITYLKGRQYEPYLIDEVINELEAGRLLNDHQFAKEWIANRQHLNPRSHRELSAELRQKGISSDVIETSLASLAEDDEVVALTYLLDKKKLRSRYGDQRKLIQYLRSKGFTMESIREALLSDEGTVT